MENEALSPAREYRPVLLSRRGEYIAWFCAALSVAAWLVLRLAKTPVFIGLQILAVLLICIALAISMGNWMDRRTVLQVETQGIYFENGLRKAQLGWQNIQQVQVFPSTWGKKVRVLGDNAHFDFRTLGEVRMDGKVKGQMGFQDGEKILSEIVQQAGLKEKSSPEESIVYYARR
jgi:hypothetical protein